MSSVETLAYHRTIRLAPFLIGDITLFCIQKYFTKPLDLPATGRCTIKAMGSDATVKINEAEALVGILKKNIRYYEEEGLLLPARDTTNGYRNYTHEDVFTLKKIKVYRKLSLPIEEIKKIMSGQLTVGEALERQKIVLSHQRNDVDKQLVLCDQMILEAVENNTMDADAYLARILDLEHEGVRFADFVQKDRKKEKRGVWFSAAGFALLMIAFAVLFIWAELEDPIPLWAFAIIESLLVIPAIGVFVAGYHRIREINGGEEDDLSQY